jgi:BirA family transcriptional regulator, biotin operon repressor / biotin---[acetyl-CoA-carboxylase] ligase
MHYTAMLKKSENIETLATVESTNSYIMNRRELCERHFYAVRAVEQTAGRGRYSRTWFSGGANDLSFSFVVHAPAIEAAGVITVLAGLALYRTLNVYADNAFKIKWPNDIYCDNRKISGILTERSVCGTYVVGIGVNVNSIGTDLSPKAISLREAAGKICDVESLMHEILDAQKKLLYDITLPLSQEILSEIRTSFSSIGKKIRFVYDDKIREGIVAGISPSCALLVVTDGSTIEYTGEVEFLE